MSVVEADPGTFDEAVLKQRGALVIVYFWGPQCPNCENFARHFPSLKEELADEPVLWVKVDAYAYPDLGTRFGIHGVPTFLLVRDGALLGRMIGFHGREFFLDVVREQNLRARSAP